jgi:hypothetical protein
VEERVVVVMLILMIMTWRTIDSHVCYEILRSMVLVSTLAIFYLSLAVPSYSNISDNSVSI